MKPTFVLLIAFLTGSLCLAQETKETKQDSKSYILCRRDNMARTIRVDVAKNGSCVATYTKEGVDQVVGRSGTSDMCESVSKNIRTNLEKASWKCRDVGEARISSSND